MDKDNKLRELGREDYIWIIFICLSILSIVADSYQRNYIIYNSKFDGEVANKIYILILVITILIYLYLPISPIIKSRALKFTNASF